MKLFEHPDFEQAILQAELHFKNVGLRAAIIEKDYYVTEPTSPLPRPQKPRHKSLPVTFYLTPLIWFIHIKILACGICQISPCCIANEYHFSALLKSGR